MTSEPTVMRLGESVPCPSCSRRFGKVHADLAPTACRGVIACARRFFMNVVLARVLYAHALVAAPSLALGRLAELARTLGDPRLGMAGAFLSLRRVVPNRYPLARDVEWYITDEQRLGRMLDCAVIVPRLQRLYEWSAEELAESRLLELVRDGNPIYAWPFEERHVWRSPHMPFAARVLEQALKPPEVLLQPSGGVAAQRSAPSCTRIKARTLGSMPVARKLHRLRT